MEGEGEGGDGIGEIPYHTYHISILMCLFYPARVFAQYPAQCCIPCAYHWDRKV